MFVVRPLDSDTLVAFGLGGLTASGKTGWLLSLGVSPEHRRQGIGVSLTREVISAAAAFGATHVRLCVSPDNEGALALYDAEGFSAEAYHPDYFGEGPRIVMIRHSGRSVAQP